MLNFRKTYSLIVFVLLLLTTTITSAYSYFDTLADIDSELISIGTWDLVDYIIGPILTGEIESTVDDEITNDPSSNLGYLYDQENAPSNVVEHINGIDIFGQEWNFWTKAKTANYTTFGYPVLIDRELDSSNNPVHDINPAYSTTDLYEGYNYFTAYDATNTLTNNQYSLRLNYNMRMTTANKISNLSNVSFYAMLGLSDPDDDLEMRETQRMYVEVSTNGSNWTRLGKKRPTQVTSESEAFTFYSYDIPSNLLGQDLYLRIRYNGRALLVNGEAQYGRLIIDDLVITTD